MSQKLRNSLTKTSLILIGFLSLIWFLIRVIPKPVRATYPCQRAAFPFASSFVIWLTGALSGKYFLKKIRHNLSSVRYILVSVFLLASIVSFSLITVPFSLSSATPGTEKGVFEPEDLPNKPVGNAKGLFPGRVVWCYNPDATNWNGGGNSQPPAGNKGTDSSEKDNYWFTEGNIIQSEVDYMISQTLRELTGKHTDPEAWDAIFVYFNKTNGKGNTGYQQGEKIAVKINLNTSGRHGKLSNKCSISPQMALGLLRQLVDKANIPARQITFYDVTRVIPSTVFDLCKKEYPGVNFVDKDGGRGRIKATIDTASRIKWSEELVLEPRSNPANPAYLPVCITQADYLINFGSLKAHNLTGLTICAKNHLGSFISPNDRNMQAAVSAGLHPYIAVRDHIGLKMRPMKSYNALVDLMGNEHLGGKTLLFLVDGLYAARSQGDVIDINCRWNSAPFSDDWTSSLFASMDAVAIESVCLDFLRAEQAVSGELSNLTGAVDNYLHEAALAHDPPSGTVYLSGKGSRLKSLGVHEHWNNPADKKYSRNLGTGEGIELISVMNIQAGS
jgi:hypothetical protein